MSTYCGEKYLRPQLNSIFAQEDVIVKLIVRDDGSTDSTLSILKEYSNIHLIQAANVGCEESYKILLYMPVEADYYAFADQDDIWYPRKLISAIENINCHKCELSVCNLMLADADMNLKTPLYNPKDILHHNFRFRNYVIGNFQGCVQVWSKKLHNIIQSYQPKVTYPHDVWVNAVANIVSFTYIDSNYYINYRLHGNNVSGVAQNIFEKISKGLKLYILSKYPTTDILCKQLLEGYGDYLDETDIRYRQLLLTSKYRENFINKIKLLFSGIVNYADFSHRCLYWFNIIINKY